MWTFETSGKDSNKWIASSGRYSSIEEAATRAMNWMAISAVNGAIVEVRLKEIK